MGRFFAAPRALPQGSTLTPLIFKVSGLVYNSAPQSEISYCTQFLRKKKCWFRPCRLFWEPRCPYPGVPRTPVPRSSRPPWNSKPQCQSRIQLHTQKLIDKRNFEGNTSKMQILAIRAILRAPGVPLDQDETRSLKVSLELNFPTRD